MKIIEHVDGFPIGTKIKLRDWYVSENPYEFEVGKKYIILEKRECAGGVHVAIIVIRFNG